jgi:glycosyltransferase involved in cell wall biosynthesis
MLEGRSVVVIVPAFDEQDHVAKVIRTAPAFVDHLIVVDDASRDATSERARSVGDPRVQILRHSLRRGVGGAIATGYAAALERTTHPEDALAVMAGDGQMHPDDLRAVVAPVVRGEADYVKGDRFGAPGVARTMGLPRWIGGQVFSRLTSWAIGARISDSQCGFTALSRGSALALDLGELWAGFGYPNDLLGRVALRGLRIREVPVRPVYGDEKSKLRLRHVPPIFFLVARAALRRRRGSALMGR